MIDQHHQLVPLRYKRTAGVLGSPFQVSLPRDTTYVPAGRWPGLECWVRAGSVYKYVVVTAAASRELIDALRYMGKLTVTVPRAEKFLRLFKAYECLGRPGDGAEFAAVRHGLSHPPSMLKEQRTVARLRNLFGSVEIDLANNQHVRVFWNVFGELLRHTDGFLQERLLSEAEALEVVHVQHVEDPF